MLLGITQEKGTRSLNPYIIQHKQVTLRKIPFYFMQRKIYPLLDFPLEVKLWSSNSYCTSINLTLLYMESFEMWYWRRMEKISWTDHVRNKEVLLTVNEQKNILQEIRKRKANWIGHILHRNCLLKQVIEGKIKWEMEVARRRKK